MQVPQVPQVQIPVIPRTDGIDWNIIVPLAITNAAAIFMAMGFFIAMIKGQFDVVRGLFTLLNDKLDGHMSKVMDAVAKVSKVEGKVDAIINKPTVITDRRDK